MNHAQAVRLDGSITFLNFKGNPVFAQGSEIGSVEPSECFAARWRASPFKKFYPAPATKITTNFRLTNAAASATLHPSAEKLSRE
jgi:hypothetical protein